MNPEAKSPGLDKAQCGEQKPAAKPFWRREQYLRFGALGLAIAVTVGIFLLRDQLMDLHLWIAYGYIGAFAISLLSTASLLFPIPGIVVVFVLGHVLNPLLLGLVAAAGMALGETTGYMVGCGGRGLLENRRLYLTVERWMERWGSLAIFLFALFPNPLFDLGGAACGALGFPLWKFLLFVFLGRTLRCVGIAYAGALSLPWVIDVLSRFF